MHSQNRSRGAPNKWVCHKCIGEDFLSGMVKTSGQRRQCNYCGSKRQSITLNELADSVERAFEAHYVRTSDQPNDWQYGLLRDKESEYEWERDGVPVVEAIADAAMLGDAIASDVQALLENRHSDFELAKMGEETEFESDSYYEPRELKPHDWQFAWHQFVRSLKTNARFFNDFAAAHLESVFDGLDFMRTKDGAPVVSAGGPNSQFERIFRARVFPAPESLDDALCRPDTHIGPPPAKLAKAGRMNAAGVAVFYGSDRAAIALAEVRPPVGSHVVVAEFEIVRPLRLLDLSALKAVAEVGSVFDTTYAARLERAAFLRTLCDLTTRPVMPDDEAFDYLPTQAVADFLASRAASPIDGIVFPSVQAEGDGANVVLFQKASRVAPLEVPEGTKISAQMGYDGDGDPDFYVMEEVPPPVVQPEAATEVLGARAWLSREVPTSDGDNREVTMKVIPATVYLHEVKSVEYVTHAHEIRRQRWVRKPPSTANTRADSGDDLPF